MAGGTGTSSRIEPLTSASRLAAPAPCIDCVFWQEPRAVSDSRRKRRWLRRAQRLGVETWGRIAREGQATKGLVQYGSARLFPRAERLPAGPPSRDAALITCLLVFGEDPVGTGERLALESLADLKARGFSAVEAFSICVPDEVSERERFASHHTLIDREFLEGLGFTPVRAHGQVALMRLDLAGAEPLAPTLWERLRARLPRRASRGPGGP